MARVTGPAGDTGGRSAEDALALLWQPFALGAALLRNRVFVSAHTTNFGLGNTPTDRHAAYHRERAAGGVALITTEGVRVHPTSAARDSSLGAFSDECIPAYARIVDGVHEEGAVVFAQLIHLGRQAVGDTTRTAAWAPSARPWAAGAHIPHAMGQQDIDAVVRGFGAAARRMLGAGFDGLEIHVGHGHLLQQFLSPVTNGRSDRYGGTPDARLRLTREVLTDVLAATGERCPVGIRISADEFLPGGLTPDDMLDVVDRLNREFPLAFLNVSHSAYAGTFSLATQMADMSFPPAPFRHFPATFKAAFPTLPVMAVCRLDTVETAASLLADDAADLVGMTRAHIADPWLIAKVRGGRADEVRSCISCNQGCIGRIEKNVALSCVVNPEVGFEAEWAQWRSRRADRPKDRRVLVVGGGPAGLEAAVTARRLGHEVVLAEADSVLGGQIARVARLPNRERFSLLVGELARDAARLGVDLRLGTCIGPPDVRDAGWDAVVFATGSRPAGRRLDGLTVLTTWEAMELGRTDESPIAIVDETGDWAAAALTEHLAAQGRTVHLVVPIAGLAWNITTYSRLALMDRLGRAGVRVHPLRRVVRGDADGLVVADTLTGETSLLPAVHTVVHVGPPVAEDTLFRELEGTDALPPHVVVGDAYAPRSALEAVYEARLATAELLGGDRVTSGQAAR